mmetsp:Transcript_11340/g.42516  ORF Transcript_11340/g.42516 Transcript_11340/m.42516 type:complete len:323 (+) Transcript_11340:619-1587(+)
MLNDALELVSLEAGLLSNHVLLLALLFLASLGELLVHAALLVGLLARLLSPVALVLLLGTFCTKSIHFCSLVLSLLLHGTETSNFTLLLCLDAILLSLESFLALLLLEIVGSNLEIFFDGSLSLLLLHEDLLGVGLSNLLNELLSCLLFAASLLIVLSFHVLNVFEHGLLLLLLEFLLATTLALALLDLFSNNGCTLATILHALLLALLIHFQCLESLQLHCLVQFALLLFAMLLNGFLFIELHVANGDTLSVEHEGVHVLHIIDLFVHLNSCLLNTFLFLFNSFPLQITQVLFTQFLFPLVNLFDFLSSLTSSSNLLHFLL